MESRLSVRDAFRSRNGVRVLEAPEKTTWSRLAYGIVIRDLPLIILDLAGLGAAALVLHITLTLRSQRACPIV
jgi:hypothetical protein